MMLASTLGKIALINLASLIDKFLRLFSYSDG